MLTLTHRHCLQTVQTITWANLNLQIRTKKIRRVSQQPIWLIYEAGQSKYFLQAFLKIFELFPLQSNIKTSICLWNFQSVAPKCWCVCTKTHVIVFHKKVAIRLQADDPVFKSRQILRDFSHIQNIRTRYGAHSPLFSVGKWGSLHRRNAVEASGWQLTSTFLPRLRMSGTLYPLPHTPARRGAR